MKLTILVCFLLQLLHFGASAQETDTIRIYFAEWQHKLTSAHRQKLQKVAQLAARKPSVKLMVFGYADPVGNQQSNQLLSEQRAQSVVDYLTAKGVNPNQIVQKAGKGERPGTDDAAEEKHNAEDRRVDVLVRQPATGTEDILQLSEGQTLVLRALTFLPGKHILRPEAMPELNKLLLLLRQHPNLEIEIQGHICCENRQDGLDFDTGQNNLSTSRAKFVYDYLTEQGIDPNRLRYRGYGRTRPLIKEERTEEDRNLNRRVEIKVLKK